MIAARGRSPLLALVLALGLGAAFAGCGAKGVLVPNLAPETVVFVSGPVDTVNHVARLRWFGSDPDGQVMRYEIRWVYPAGQGPAGYDSSTWTSTLNTDSTFTVSAPAGYSMPTFVVRAIDNQGLADPTPARETFQFSNQTPSVHLINLPLPTTLPVLTIAWSSTDADGDIAKASYLVWLDGNEAGATLVPAGNQFTLPPAMFSDGAGGYLTGQHTVHIRAVDDGGSVSPPDSARWNVVLPQGQVLLVDDDPDAISTQPDLMYLNAFNRQLGSSSAYTLMKLEANNPFRSAADLRYSFAFYHSVFWYQENSPARSTTLGLAEPAIRSLLAGGGNVYVASVNLMGTSGAFTNPAFLADIVGADSLRTNLADASTNFAIPNQSVIYANAGTPYDSLRAVVNASDVDALVLKSAADAAFLAPAGVLDTLQFVDWVVGVDRVPAGGGGRFVYLAFPLRFLGGAPIGAPSPAPDGNYGEKTVRRVLYRFGHGTAP